MIDGIKQRVPLNFELLGNPINWIIVCLMILMAGLAVSLIFHPSDQTGDK